MDLRIDEKGKYFTQRIAKDTLVALIRTNEQVIVGNVYVRPDRRLKDEFGEDNTRFLPVTEACVYNAADETLLYQSAFLLVAYAHILMISPLDAMEDIRAVPWSHQREEGAEV